MKFVKRGMAAWLAAVLIVTALPVSAAQGASVSRNGVGEPTVSRNGISDGAGNQEETGVKDSPTSQQSVSPNGIEPDVEEIFYNTGNHAWSVVSKEDFEEKGVGDACFEEDGSYTINIPEANPFFPYEVQFTHDGQVVNKWFMTPDDSVEIGGHTFRVSAYFDNTTVTQMSLNIGGDQVVVYPEEKTFTNDGAGIAPMSLLPLEEITLGPIDLTGYTPLELTMVGVDYIFGNTLADTDKVVWTYQSEDNYTISEKGDTIDLSRDTYSGGIKYWEMIVGSGDQLDSSNVRYTVPIRVTASENWLEASVYHYETDFNDKALYGREFTVFKNSYYDFDEDNRYLDVRVSEGECGYAIFTHIGLNINPIIFDKTNIDHVKVYGGDQPFIDDYHDITDAVWNLDVTKEPPILEGTFEAFWRWRGDRNQIILAAFDAENNMIGQLPMFVNWDAIQDGFDVVFYDKQGTDRVEVGETFYRDVYHNEEPSTSFIRVEMPEGYKEKGTYYLHIKPNDISTIKENDVTAVYIDFAAENKQNDIKEAVLGDGYEVDFTEKGWIRLVVLVGENGSDEQKRYVYTIGIQGKTDEKYLSSLCNLTFTGLANQNADSIFITEESDDSYGENNYITMLVDSNTDLTSLAPEFYSSTGAKVYTAGASKEEISGVSLHDFSNGPIQYTVLAEDGKTSRNYWLQIKQAVTGKGQLYINSFADKDANTREENGIIYSTREVMLDGFHDYIHDIWLSNIGTEAIPRLSAVLDSDVVELDPYWTLTGNQDLAGFTTTQTDKIHGQLANLAKLRLRAKEGVQEGTDVTGTLTIRSGSATLAVLTLTGTIGDPCITTAEIPAAVKYVPYGTMIQNSNKYDWIQPAYSLNSGSLPAGMEIRPNGELYGVPQETGSFWFSVEAVFEGRGQVYSSVVYFTLEVKENTDANVYLESDPGYMVLTPIGTETIPGSYDFYLAEIDDTLFVSEGLFEGFTDLWLNGQRLEKGVDYTAESGSTRITIRSQTFTNKANPQGRNTIAAEFREGDDENKELKRTAQNFRLDLPQTEQGGENGSSGNSGSRHKNEAGASQPTINLLGYVVDAANTPLPGLTAELHSTPRSTVTADDGFFRFLDVEFGQHTLYIKDQNANILASESIELLNGEAFALNGTVITAAPDSSVTLTVKVDNGKLILSAAGSQATGENQLLAASAKTGDSQAAEMLLTASAISGFTVVFLYIFRKRKTGIRFR